MLEVDIEKILPVTEVRDSLNKIVDEVAANDTLYVLTVNGKPSAVVVGVHHLEKLTGASQDSIVTMTTSTQAEQPAVSPASTPQADTAAETFPTPPSNTTDVAPIMQAAPAAPQTDTNTMVAPASTPLPELTPEPEVVAPAQPSQPLATASEDASDDLSFNINPAVPPTSGPDNQFKTPASDDVSTQQADATSTAGSQQV